MSVMKTKNNFLLILTFTVIIAIIVGCSEKASDTVEERHIPVKISTVSYGALSGSNLLNGTIEAEDEADVMAKMMGEIKKINVKKGDKVNSGQVIAELDSFDERNALQQQQAQLKQALSGLKSAQNGKSTAEGNLRQAEAALKQAEASLAEARKSLNDNLDNIDFQIKSADIAYKQTKQNYDRVKQLYEEGLVSKADYDEVKAGLENAKVALDQAKLQKSQANSDIGLRSLEASVDQARIGVDIARASIRDTDIAVEQAEASVEQAQLGVEAAQERLDDKLIKSPISGEVVDIAFKVGEMANQQTPFATIVSIDKVKVTVNVLPEMLNAFKVGDEVKVKVGSDQEKSYKAKVSYVASVSTGSGLFAVEAELIDQDDSVKPGMVAQIEVDEVLVADSLLVPTDAIIQQEGLDVVFIIEDDVAVRKEVEIIRYGSQLSAVAGDIKDADKVVISGQNLLEDGDSVQVMEEEVIDETTHSDVD